MYGRIVLAALIAAALPATAANKIQIADEGNLGQWSLVPGTQLMPPYPEAYAANPEEVCLVVGYLVNADGTTSDFSLLKSWTSGNNSRNRTAFWSGFGDMASRALAQWRYAPRNEASPAEPVYTAATFVFGKPQAAGYTREHCAVPGVAARLLELRNDSRANRRMVAGIFSRLDIDPEGDERLRQLTVQQRENLQRQEQLRAEQALSGYQQATTDQPFPPSAN